MLKRSLPEAVSKQPLIKSSSYKLAKLLAGSFTVFTRYVSLNGLGTILALAQNDSIQKNFKTSLISTDWKGVVQLRTSQGLCLD